MKRPTFKTTLSATALLAVILIAAATTLAGPPSTPLHTATNASHTQKQHSAKQASTPPPSASATSAPSSTDTSATDTHSNVSTSPACALLSQAIATQALGADSQSSAANTKLLPETADTTVSYCAYATAAESLQLSLRTPKNALGTSENATPFGSEKPANATIVSGYGQAAYWNPASHQLNILAGNCWYAITMHIGGQPADATHTEAAAKLLAPKL